MKNTNTNTNNTNTNNEILYPVNPQTEVLSMMDSLGIPAVEIKAPTSSYLPYIYIEQKEKENLYKAVMVVNSAPIPLNEPYIIIPITARKVLRKLEGNQYTERYYQGGKTDIQFTANLKNPSCKEGIVFIVAVINESGAIVAKIEACGAMQAYWSVPLALGKIQKGIAIKINEINHAGNTKQGKNGTYLSAYKFKNFEPVTLTNQQLKAIHNAVTKQREQLDTFLQE